MNDFQAPVEETFRVDPSYMMAQLQKENAELTQQLTLQRAAHQQLVDTNAHLGRELSLVRGQLDDANLNIQRWQNEALEFAAFRDMVNESGSDFDKLRDELCLATGRSKPKVLEDNCNTHEMLDIE